MFIFVTVPFKGHSNVIIRSAEEFASKGNKVRLIILTWSNFPVEMPTNTLLHTTLLTSNVPITSSKPTEFTWDRTNNLTGELYKLCLQWHQYAVIDWIIYDFFCPEALIVSEALRVPSVCSIPAIFPIDCIESAYHKESVLKLKPILDEISQKWNLKPMLSERLMPVSDSFYISGSQKQWLWAHPSLYENIPLTFGLFTSPIFVTRNTCNSPKIFLTKDSKNYPFDRYADQNNPMKETIYVCLGTVVTGNLWKKHAEARNLAQLVFSSVIDYVLKKRIRAIISIPGLPLPHLLVPKKHPLTEKEQSEKEQSEKEQSEKEQSEKEQSERSQLDSKIVRLCEENPNFDLRSDLMGIFSRYEKNPDLIQIVNFVDQIAILNQKSTKLFITHGGGNSVSEAIDAGTPMLVIPFFGDQHVSAELVEKAGLGFSFKHERPDLAIDTICTIHDKRIDNGTSFLELLEKTYKHFTGSHFTGSHFTGSKKSLNSLNSLNNQNHQSISISDIELPGNVVNFRSGDLLYGVNIARMRFQTSTKGLFDVGDMRPPSTRLPRLPALIDHYNDVLRLEDSSPVRAKELKENDSSTEYGSRLHALENYYRNKHFPSVSNHAYPPTNLEGLWHACCGGLAYFLLERRDTFIHFVIHPEYDSNINKATTLELRWIREHYAEVYDRVRFYWFLPTNDGSLEACNPLALNWFEWRLDEIQKYLDNRNIAEADIITDHLPTLKQGRGAIYVEKRLKTAHSLYEKIKIRGKREGIIDGIGIRFIHLWTNQLSLIADQLVSYVKHHVHLKCISERGRVIHLVFYPTSGSNVFKPIEVQLWPIALHTCFESEHDTIYKARIAPTQEQLAESRILRQKEHELQSLIDAEASSLSCWR